LSTDHFSKNWGVEALAKSVFSYYVLLNTSRRVVLTDGVIIFYNLLLPWKELPS